MKNERMKEITVGDYFITEMGKLNVVGYYFDNESTGINQDVYTLEWDEDKKQGKSIKIKLYREPLEWKANKLGWTLHDYKGRIAWQGKHDEAQKEVSKPVLEVEVKQDKEVKVEKPEGTKIKVEPIIAVGYKFKTNQGVFQITNYTYDTRGNCGIVEYYKLEQLGQTEPKVEYQVTTPQLMKLIKEESWIKIEELEDNPEYKALKECQEELSNISKALWGISTKIEKITTEINKL